MSLGRIFASMTSVSSSGTTSMISLPGWITPPMVFTSSCLTIPRTGEVTSVRCTRSSSALLVAVALFSSVRASFSWVSASLRNLPRVSSILLCTSRIAASARGVASAVESS
ncbi:hypothetical protein D3C75_1196080 [compost metagenome]